VTSRRAATGNEKAPVAELADKRANAQLKTWKILTKLRCCTWRAGQLAKAIHVLQLREA
jgi:ethanolamine ammonia-lyase small subunit